MIKFRNGKKQDIKQIWKIEKDNRILETKITQQEYRRLIETEIDAKAESEFVKGLEKDINSSENIFLVAESSGIVIGWIYAEIGTWSFDNPIKILWIEDIGVLKKYQRKGIGKKLLEKVEKTARKKRIEYSVISVNQKNRLAYDLYKRTGYKEFSMEMLKKL